jgi:predicted Fe-S protein YdhL (DUF1289 family)
MAEAGKGSRHRPVNKEAFEAGWDRIFGGVSSPCVDVCDMDYAANICRGCHRTLDEVAAWGYANNDERQRILNNVEERKKHAQSNNT